MMDWTTRAINFVLAMEKGYVNDPQDPGGETKYGISKRAYPDLDITNLTLDHAMQIYREDYLQKPLINTLPAKAGLICLDFSVTSGPERAIPILQETVGTKPDGVIGPKTVSACLLMEDLPLWYTVNRIFYYSHLRNWPHDGHGWTKRSILCQNLTRTFNGG